jgi:SAM-dependent methyltransferase
MNRAASPVRPADLKAQFNLSYHVDCLERAARGEHLHGSCVLEIGGALPPELVLGHYRAAAWTAVDNRSAYSSMLARQHVGARVSELGASSTPAPDGGYLAYDGDAASLPDSFASAFDIVISLATFEHVENLPAALAHIRAALKPGGLLLAQVGPVWSGWRGHHVFPGHLDSEKTDDLLDHLVPWQHLVMSSSEMRQWLGNRYGPEFADTAVDWIYESPRLNRLFFEDYERMFAVAGLETRALESRGAPVPQGWETTLRPLLTSRYPRNRAFQIDCFWAVLAAPTTVA